MAQSRSPYYVKKVEKVIPYKQVKLKKASCFFLLHRDNPQMKTNEIPLVFIINK